MTTLMIKDLPVTEELDRKAMAAVHGGMINLDRPPKDLTGPHGLPLNEFMPFTQWRI